MAFHNILIPTDFSHAAWHAVQLGIDIVQNQESRITLLHVYPDAAKFDRRKSLLNAGDHDVMDAIKGKMDEFCRYLRKQTTSEIYPVMLIGDVEGEIIKSIVDQPYDLVIMGVNSNGLNNQPGTHLNSIIKNIHAPVLVVPNKLIPEKIAV